MFSVILPIYLQGQVRSAYIQRPSDDQITEGHRRTPIAASKYLTWNNVYSPTIDTQLVASFIVSDSIPSNTKALLLHGLSYWDFEKELKSITRLKDIEFLSIMPLPSDDRFMLPGGRGQLDWEIYKLNLKRISSWISSLPNLKTLHIEYPPSEISQAIIGCSQLKALYIEGGSKFIMEIPKDLKMKNRSILPKLKFLRIDDVPFESFPDEFSELKIETLILMGTNGIPNFVYKLKKLKKLHLSIDVIDPNIGKIRGLKELSITSIKMSSLPVEILQLKKLEWLSLSLLENDTVPQTLLSRMNLSTLFLYAPYAKNLKLQASFNHLEHLYISGIQNTSVDMSKLKSLRTLVVNNVGRVKFVGTSNSVKRLCHFQIFSESPREFTIVENWRSLFDNIKSFKSISLFRVQLEDEQSNKEPVFLNAKEVLIDVKLFKSGVLEGNFKKLKVVECYEQRTRIYLTESQIENISEKQKEFEYCNSFYNQDLIYSRDFLFINLSNGYGK